MTLTEIQTKIEASIQNSTVTMQGDGCNCSTLVVSPLFEGMSLLARQKMVLAAVRTEIDSGELHALSIKARTPAEENLVK
ncbi:MAG: BolA/IbaG family iron-sulfur metabolism protein [Gammaproteobacteria bacterium]|nr:BolA/IbaG family iron-sulfur metabolism protein [Gammaproteobacteria bacterium]